MTNFSVTDEHQDVAESIHTKNISIGTEYGSVEDPLSKHRTGSNDENVTELDQMMKMS